MNGLPLGEGAEEGNLEGRLVGFCYCTILVRQQRECHALLLQTRIVAFTIRFGVIRADGNTADMTETSIVMHNDDAD